MNYSSRFLKKINEEKKNYEIRHTFNSDGGSSGGPIINSMNYKVIGIHKGASNRDYNLGTFLQKPLQEFKEKRMKNKEYIGNKKNKKEIKSNNKNNNNDKIKEEKYVEKIINNKIDCMCRIEMEINVEDKLKFINVMGFLCNITLKNMKVLITYNHIINLDILNNEKILVYINNNNENKNIDMRKKRYKYTNE